MLRALIVGLVGISFSAARLPAEMPAEKPKAESPETLPVVYPGHDWPGFLGPTGDGKSEEKILLDWPEKGLDILWFKTVGEGYSAPSIADGRIFVFDRVKDRARLSAWDSVTGKELWQESYTTSYEDLYQYSGGPRTSPVVDGERVYAFGVEGRLRAHSVETGKVLWEVDTAAQFGVVQNFFGVGGTPIIEGDLLIAQVGGSPAESPSISSGEVKGNGSAVVAFDKMTGKVRYRLSDQLASYSSPRVTTLGGSPWGFVFTRGGLLAFDPREGTERFFYPWRARKLESVNASTPVLVGDTVFVSEAYGPGSVLLRFSAKGPEVIWKDPPRRGQSLQTHWSTPIFHDGYLYASSGQNRGDAQLRAVEHATGKVAWKEPGLGRSTLLYADGHFVALTETGRLLLLEATPERFHLLAEMNLGASDDVTNAAAKTGAVAASDRPILRYPSWNAPVLSHGRLYVRGKDQVICLDIAPRPASK